MPVDRTTEIVAELGSVIAAIDRIEDDVDRLVVAARGRAEQRGTSAHAEAARMIAEAKERAPAEREAAYAERLRVAADEMRRAAEAARREAARIREVAGAREPEIVNAVLRHLLEARAE
jgi:vacuolar-type H+-ATPase subunit H